MKNRLNASALALTLILSCWIAPGAAQAAPDWVPEGEIKWDCSYDGAALPTECEPSWRESIGASTEAKVEDEGLRIVDSGGRSPRAAYRT